MWTMLAVVLTASVPISGTTTCPTAEAVSRALERLAPTADGLPSVEVRLSQRPDVLEIELRSASVEVARRSLPRTTRCEALAEAAAAVIVVWLGRFEGGAWPELAPPAVALTPNEPAAAPSRWGLEIGAGAGLSYNVAPAVGFVVSVSILHRATGLGLRLEGLSTTSRRLPLEEGAVTFHRLQLGLGVGASFRPKRLRLDVFAGAGVGRLFAKGQGFDATALAAAWELPLFAGLCVGWPLGRLFPYLQGGVSVGLQTHRAVVEGGGAVALPSVEGLLLAGLRFDVL